MGLPSLAIKRPISTMMFYIALCIFGVISLFALEVELYQGQNQSIISIVIRARGGLPATEVEKMITKPTEEAVATVTGIHTLYSNSREAESRVTMEFEPGTNMKFAALEIREKFARVRPLLPKEIEKPVIANYDDAQAAILIFAVTSDRYSTEDIREKVDNELKPILSRVDGVASVEVYGGRERKIMIELDRDKMMEYNIPIERVMDILGQSNVNLLAGSVKTGKLQLAIRSMGAFNSVSEIAETGIKATRQGTIIPLKEIATVKDAYMEASNHARLNLEQNVTVYIKKESLANTISVVKAAHAAVNQYEKNYKGEFRVITVNDRADTIANAIGTVSGELFMGLILTVYTICVFLKRTKSIFVSFLGIPVAAFYYFTFAKIFHDPNNLFDLTIFFMMVATLVGMYLDRAIVAFIVVLTIPVSLMITFIFMEACNISINVMTLTGLALAMGNLVDSAIVVTESVLAKKEEGKTDFAAIHEGAEEVWLPLLTSLATTLIVFLPILFIDKRVQIMYSGLAFTVSFSLISSFFVALMLAPMMFSQFARGKLMIEKVHHRTILDRFCDWYHGFMKGILDGTAFKRGVILLVFAAVAVTGTTLLFKKSIDWPSTYEENEFAVISFPLAGAKLETNDEAMKKIEQILNKIPDVQIFSSTISKDDLRIFVRLKPKNQRKYSKSEIMKMIDEQGNAAIKEIHNDFSLIVDEGSGSSEQKKMVIEIFGYDNDELEKLAKQFAQKVRDVPGISNIVMTDLRKRPEYSIKVDRRAALYGLSVKKVADSLHAQIRGMRPTEFHELAKGERIEMITRLQPIYRQKIDDLKLVPIGTDLGVQIPLQEIANFYPTVGPQTIDRKNKYRYVFVKCDIKRPVEDIAKDIDKVLTGIKMPDDYFWRFGGGYEDLLASKSQLFVAVLITVFLVYMVMACLFQDFLSPLLIMVTVPMALIGVWIALDWPNFIRWPLMLLGLPVEKWTWLPQAKPLSQQVLIGIVMLGGYVVTAAIIMTDYYKSLLADGMEMKEALVESVVDRFRPILMTTMTTVLGFAPMAFSIGTTSDLWAPMAVTGIGGMIMGTVLTLFVLPILIYFIAEERRVVAGIIDLIVIPILYGFLLALVIKPWESGPNKIYWLIVWNLMNSMLPVIRDMFFSPGRTAMKLKLISLKSEKVSLLQVVRRNALLMIPGVSLAGCLFEFIMIIKKGHRFEDAWAQTQIVDHELEFKSRKIDVGLLAPGQ